MLSLLACIAKMLNSTSEGMSVHCNNVHLQAPQSSIPVCYTWKSHSPLSEHESLHLIVCDNKGISKGREKREKVKKMGRG